MKNMKKVTNLSEYKLDKTTKELEKDLRKKKLINRVGHHRLQAYAYIKLSNELNNDY